MFVLQIGSELQTSTCNVNIGSVGTSDSMGWVFLQYTPNKVIKIYILFKYLTQEF